MLKKVSFLGLITAHKIDENMFYKIKNNVRINSDIPFSIIILGIDSK